MKYLCKCSARKFSVFGLGLQYRDAILWCVTYWLFWHAKMWGAKGYSCPLTSKSGGQMPPCPRLLRLCISSTNSRNVDRLFWCSCSYHGWQAKFWWTIGCYAYHNSVNDVDLLMLFRNIGPMAICLHRRCIIGMWKHYCVDSTSYQRSNTERRGCCSLDWVSQTGSSRQGLVRKAQHRGFAEKSILPEK